jgi:hypothetical protein
MLDLGQISGWPRGIDDPIRHESPGMAMIGDVQRVARARYPHDRVQRVRGLLFGFIVRAKDARPSLKNSNRENVLAFFDQNR